MTVFIKDGFVCNVIRDLEEPIEHFNQRGYFIVSQKPTNNTEYNNALLYSKIYINKKYNKCGYSSNVENMLNNMMKNYNGE